MARAVPSSPLAALLRTQRDATIAALEAAIAQGQDGIGPLPSFYLSDDEDMQEDDPLIRALWQRLENGPISQQSAVHLLQETDKQRQREQSYAASASRLASVGAAAPTPSTTLRWSQLGPQSALSEWNGSFYDGLDSGRVATVRADPTNPAAIYIGAIGGGIWKTADITLTRPVWTPLTDTLARCSSGPSISIPPTPT